MGVFDQLEIHQDVTAVISDGNKSYLYNQLTADADALHQELGAGKLVVFIASNCYASIAGYVGMLRGKAVPLMLPATTSKDELNQIVTAYLPEYIFAPIDASERLGLGVTQARLENYGLFASPGGSETPLHDDLALLLTTSGSTGSRSLVRLSANNISSNAAQIIEYLGITADDTTITTMPMSYSYGLSVLNTHLLQGASIVVTEEPLMSRDFWNLMRDKSVTSFAGVPFIYEMLQKLRFHRMDLPALGTLTQAGGRLSEELVHYFIEACQGFGADFYVMYGQTEATARMTYMPPAELKNRPNSIGIPVPSSEIFLENTDNSGVTSDRDTCDSGELVFKGPNVSLGSAENRADLARGDENNGVLHTGDIVTRDTEGFLTVTGRKKRFLKLYGNRVNLAEIEELLSSEKHTSACAGSDDNLRIFIEAAPDADTSELNAAIKKLITNKTSILPRAYKIVPIEKFPRTESGKISYHLLNTQFAAG